MHPPLVTPFPVRRLNHVSWFVENICAVIFPFWSPLTPILTLFLFLDIVLGWSHRHRSLHNPRYQWPKLTCCAQGSCTTLRVYYDSSSKEQKDPEYRHGNVTA
ncbi:hypothetical protein EI94DRAFT_1723396 [Lactarius quietus]|nr:hypothetical protein EI94DRAFT_1723396 [Lactarius quietus]